MSPVSGGHLDKSQVRRTGAQNLASRIRQIAPLLRPHVGDIVLIAVLLLVASGLGMFLPILTGRIIDALPTGNIRIIVLLVAIQLVVGLVQAAVGYVQNRVSSAFSLGLGTKLRIALASKLQRAHLGQFISRPIGEITNRLDGDVQSVVSSILGISPSFVAACGLLWMLVVLPLLNWRLAIVACAFIPLWFIALLPAGPRLSRFTKSISEARDRLDTAISETLGFRGILRAKSLVAYAKDLRRISESLSDFSRLYLARLTAGLPVTMAQAVLSSIAPAAVLLVGAWLIVHRECSTGILVAFLGLMGRAYGPVATLAGLHLQLVSLRGVFDRFFELLDMESEPDHGQSYTANDLRFDNVSFGYDGRPVLNRVSLQFRRASRTHIMGASGAGKTTLAYLMLRLYQPSAGTIFLGSRALSEVAINDLRRTVAFVPQEPNLVTGSVIENVAYGCESSDAGDVRAILKVCQLSADIANLPEDVEANIGAEGARLSGGQRQRMMIARALLAQPKILVLDEATSALDSATETALLNGITQLNPDMTLIVISHRTPEIHFDETIELLPGALHESAHFLMR